MIVVVVVAGENTSSWGQQSSRVVKLDPVPVPGAVRDPVPPPPPPPPPCSSP